MQSRGDIRRIWQVTSSKAWGGRESLPVHLHQTFHSMGHQSDLFCSTDSAIAQRHGDDNNVHPLPFSNRIGGSTLRRLRRQYAQAQPEVIICHFSRDLFVLRRLLGRRRKARLVLVKHIGPGKHKGDLIHRWIYAGVDRVLGVSRYITERCVEAYPIDPAKAAVWYPGIDPNLFVPRPELREDLRRELSLKESDSLIVYVARLTPGKGHEELVQAFQRIAIKHENARLALVGSASPAEQRFAETLRDLVNSGPDPHRVLLPGFQENIHAWLNAADLFVNPSPKEAFGLNTLEAMATGLAVIGTTGGGTPDLIESGEDGILVRPDNAAALAAAMDSLLIDPTERKRLGQAALHKARSRFTLTDVALRLLQSTMATAA